MTRDQMQQHRAQERAGAATRQGQQEQAATAWYARYSSQAGAVGPFRFRRPLTESEAEAEITTQMGARPAEVWPTRDRFSL